MKIALNTVIAFVFCSFFLFQEKQPNVTIILHLDKELSQTEQTLYLVSFCSWVSGFEQNIWDSIQIQKGQRNITLHAYAPARGNLFRVAFSKEGPYELGIYANPNDTIEMEVKHTDIGRTVYKKASRGQYHNDWMKYYLAERELWKKKRLLAAGTKDADSLTNLNNRMIGFYYEQFNRTKHFGIAKSCVTILRTQFANIISKDSILTLRRQFAETYPDDPRASMDHGYNTMQTTHGKHVAQRLKEINIARMNYERSKRSTQIGETLNLTLCGADENKIAISDLTKCQYIYVDIWATWCGPCKAQFPYIEKVLKKYSKDLKVYAISIDQNHESWKKAITKKPLKSFVNVIGTDNDWKTLKEVKDLGIDRIPRSFLLDKNCKIIAKDLHDGELMEVLDSLLQK